MNTTLNAVLTASPYLGAAYVFAQHKAEFWQGFDTPREAGFLASYANSHMMAFLLMMLGIGVLIATGFIMGGGGSGTGVIFGLVGGAVIVAKCGPT